MKKSNIENSLIIDEFFDVCFKNMANIKDILVGDPAPNIFPTLIISWNVRDITMNRFEKALDRINLNVIPEDNWNKEDYEHLKTITEALEIASDIYSKGSEAHE